MSDPTQPTQDDDHHETLADVVEDIIPGGRDDEPVDEDLDADEVDSSKADEQAAREGTKGDADTV
ncbi:hypothetical protein AAIB33_02895 [Microbacterium sp. AZCO]|uniref:hypothetical protein n=1 Tax=Microbacterium sp. AZCO TaxID=3142976 RepID=UPI0031F3CD98